MSQSKLRRAGGLPDNKDQGITDVASLLLRLGRPGAHLRSTGQGAAAIIGASRGAALSVPSQIALAARSAGLLKVSGETSAGCEVLSDEGRSALRQLLMSAAAKNGDRRGSTKGGHGQRPRARQFMAERQPQRATVVQQLAARRDSRGQPLLSETQVNVALRFANDFLLAKLQPNVTMRWSAEPSAQPRRRGAPGAGIELAEVTSAAQQRVRDALRHLGGALADIVVDVCAFERGLENIEASRRWPSRSARIILAIALDRLAEHYGMTLNAASAVQKKRQWGDQSFRPSLDAWIES